MVLFQFSSHPDDCSFCLDHRGHDGHHIDRDPGHLRNPPSDSEVKPNSFIVNIDLFPLQRQIDIDKKILHDWKVNS